MGLQRRQAELRRQCTAYLQQECLRLQTAGESAALGKASQQSPKAGNAVAEELEEVAVVAQEAWRSAQGVLQRVDGLLKGFEKASGRGSAFESSKDALSGEAAAFFAEAVRFCADCDETEAEWASVSNGVYLCMECAGRHRGLGVHLSFVRSLTMDRWSPNQLCFMQLGGSKRFRAFLEDFPKLAGPLSAKDLASAEAPRRRYASK